MSPEAIGVLALFGLGSLGVGGCKLANALEGGSEHGLGYGVFGALISLITGLGLLFLAVVKFIRRP